MSYILSYFQFVELYFTLFPIISYSRVTISLVICMPLEVSPLRYVSTHSIQHSLAEPEKARKKIYFLTEKVISRGITVYSETKNNLSVRNMENLMKISK